MRNGGRTGNSALGSKPWSTSTSVPSGAQVHGGAAARTVGLLNARAERARQPLQILCLRDREAEA
jgi:hypothetical protein